MRRLPPLLLAALAAQAILLLPRLGLLPIWGDEQVTLALIAAPMDKMFAMLKADYHPPLYYLFLKVWTRLLPESMGVIEKVRLASVLFTLIATALIYRFWLRDLDAKIRAWFLWLWVLSPLLLLYARMGRSYSLQLLLAAIAIRLAVDWIQNPSLARAVRFGIAESILLYVHYLPGLGVLIAFFSIGLYRMVRGERERWTGLAAAAAACAVVYGPWGLALIRAVGRSPNIGSHHVIPNFLLEHVVRLAYTFVAFNFGETLPLWGIAVGAIVSPLIVYLVVVAAGSLRPVWWQVVGIAAVAVYAVVSRMLILALTPPRLLFTLPFFLLLLVEGCRRRPAMGTVVLTGLTLMSIGGAVSYHRKQDFFNKGYVIPFDEIGARAARDISGPKGLFIVDGSNTDPMPLLHALPAPVQVVRGFTERSLYTARNRMRDPRVHTVWLVRNTHDVSPNRWSSRLAAEVLQTMRCGKRTGYVAYGAADRLFMQAMQWREKPEYVIELLECTRPAAP